MHWGLQIMKVFLVLLKKDLKLVFRDIKTVVILALAPFLFIALFSGVVEILLDEDDYVKPFEIALADGENSIRTRILIEQLKGTGIFSDMLVVSEEEAREMVHSSKVPAAVIIPPGFTSSIEVGENKPVEIVGSTSNPYQARIVYNIIGSAATMVSAGQAAVNTIYHYDRLAGMKGGDLDRRFDETLAEVMNMAISRRRFFTKIPAPAGYDVTPGEYLAAAALSIFLMFAGLPAAKMFIAEKNTGVFTRVVSARAKTYQVLASKILMTLFMGIIQFSAVFVLTYFFMGVYWEGNIPLAVAVTLATLFSVLCWAALVAVISPSPASADMIGSLGIIIIAIIGGCIYPLHSLPDAIRGLSPLMVSRWTMEGYMAVFSGTGGFNITRYLVLIMGTGLLFLAVALCIGAFKAVGIRILDYSRRAHGGKRG